jgi:hypothetical protein
VSRRRAPEVRAVCTLRRYSSSMSVGTHQVGAIDDPIWFEEPDVPELAHHGTQIHPRRWSYGIVGLILVGLVGLVMALSWDSGHPGGDPGGVIAAEARAAVSRALPPGAEVVGRESSGSQYGTCGYQNQGSGWSPVVSSAGFTTTLTDGQVISAATAALASQGWRRTSATTTSATWTTTLESGSPARLRLIKGYVVVNGWTAWIDAQAKGTTCGGTSKL